MPPFGPACAAALLTGTGLCLLAPVLPPVTASAGLCVLALYLWGRRWRARWCGALLFGFAWTALHGALALHRQLPPLLEKEELVVTGRVSGLPSHGARQTRFDFQIESADITERLDGRRVILSWYDDHDAKMPGPRVRLRAGERWRFAVKLRAPRGLRNPGGFDSERHAVAQRIAATGYVRKAFSARRLGKARGLMAWREQMSARIGQGVPASSSRFLRALALGDTRGLTDPDWQVLRASGLTHLIAISGFHVGMVAAALASLVGLLWRVGAWLPRHLPRPQAMAIASAFAGLGYAALAGFALPTVRTVLMMSVWALARLGRRPATVGQALALALSAVLLFDPLAPLTAGFWLSFAGVAWLAWCLPDDQTSPMWRSFLSAQAVATVGLLPLSVVLFDQASLLGPFLNLLAIPWWTLVVVPLSLLALALESIAPAAGLPIWRLAAACFDGLWPLIEACARSRLALWWLPEASIGALPLALLGALWLLLPRGVPGKPLALLLWCPLLWPNRQWPARGEVQVAVIDVGQGLSVLVQTHRHRLLYDTGPATRDGFDAGERAVVPALRAWGVSELDRMVLSHGDNDHAGGQASVHAALQVADSLAPPGMPALSPRLPAPVRPCVRGQAWRWDGVRFRVLHPDAHFPYLGNEASCVLRIETVHGSVLLTGDIGQVIERELLRSQPRAVRNEVVVVAHHGSGGSSDPGFVAASHARLALVASGHGNRFGHPRPEVVQRWQQAGAEVLDTARSGAIQVWLGAGGLSVRERRHAHARWWDAVERQQQWQSEPENPRKSLPGRGGDSL
ncbi:DNA internalization-related competence protein ComEC/Rec2 [Pseudoxanthomonas indica]|uniref:DNA internalization-related competence protein ComEC/Rec2 n=1 Tax=Pseudoxanthomonas indica TaxID=428993 RepID=UPI001E5EFED2|nr:DNA internalization-related competence protein ComEC/Rec2 [Pseudoxanthomonas indica]